MLDARHLHHVLALARHRNFARAAESLHISQPALSRSIAGLEQGLGVQLFDRMTSGVEPTVFGQLVIDRGHEIVDREEVLRRELILMQGGEIGELSIGAGPFPFDISVCKAAGDLLAARPKLKLTIEQDNPPAIVGRILDGAIDIAVLDTRHIGDGGQLDVEPLPAHPVVCCCRRGHPLASKSRPTLAEVASYPLVGGVYPPGIVLQRGSATAAGRIDEASGEYVPAITVASLSAARQIAVRCDAILPIPPVCIESELKSGDLVIIDFALPKIQVRYGFTSRKNRTRSPAALEFMARVRQLEQDAIERDAALIADHANYGKAGRGGSGMDRISRVR